MSLMEASHVVPYCSPIYFYRCRPAKNQGKVEGDVNESNWILAAVRVSTQYVALHAAIDICSGIEIPAS